MIEQRLNNCEINSSILFQLIVEEKIVRRYLMDEIPYFFLVLLERASVPKAV